MALGIAGRIVAFDKQDPSAVFSGRVWLGDDGFIGALTHDNAPPPVGFSNAPVIDVGDGLVLPGFIDLHNHLGYNTLPLWAEPKQKKPFLHHNDWTDAPSYKTDISWPAWVVAKSEPEALLAYVQARAMAGGATAIQGWPTANRQHVQVVRDIDSEEAGTGNSNLIYTSALTKTPIDLAKIAQAIGHGAGFIYHCAEGQLGSIVAREFTDVANSGCLHKTFIGIHCNAIGNSDWVRWSATEAGTVVWSPFSNLWLYGSTTDITAAHKQKVSVCLGSDWGPSGTRNILGELKVAKLASDKLGLGLKDDELVAMITTNPGDALARCWSRPVGRLVPNGFGDVTVLRANGQGKICSQVVAARERDVMLVVVGGKPRYGDPKLMPAGIATTSVNVDGVNRKLAIPDPKDSSKAWRWADITARLDAVRKDPAGALQHAEGIRRSFAGRITDNDAPLELVLDMPGGGGLAFAGPPPDPKKVVIPPLPPLEHDKKFFDSIPGRGFHNGLLDGLKKFYE
jgi:5-methylthioadenosine/S-adenosylhomocysteine deaminase